jgi:hypothetical protein
MKSVVFCFLLVFAILSSAEDAVSRPLAALNELMPALFPEHSAQQREKLFKILHEAITSKPTKIDEKLDLSVFDIHQPGIEIENSLVQITYCREPPCVYHLLFKQDFVKVVDAMGEVNIRTSVFPEQAVQSAMKLISRSHPWPLLLDTKVEAREDYFNIGVTQYWDKKKRIPVLTSDGCGISVKKKLGYIFWFRLCLHPTPEVPEVVPVTEEAAVKAALAAISGQIPEKHETEAMLYVEEYLEDLPVGEERRWRPVWRIAFKYYVDSGRGFSISTQRTCLVDALTGNLIDPNWPITHRQQLDEANNHQRKGVKLEQD